MPIRTSAEWHIRARQAREAAERMTWKETRNVMVRTAEIFDRLARHAAQREAAERGADGLDSS